MKDKTNVVVLSTMLIILFGLIVGYNIHNIYIWRETEYDSTEEKILLSSKVDHLNDQQEDAFGKIANKVASKELGSELDSDSELEGDSILVGKASGEHSYHIRYVCEGKKYGDTVKYDTEFYVTPGSSLKRGNASYSLFTSEKEYEDDDYDY